MDQVLFVIAVFIVGALVGVTWRETHTVRELRLQLGLLNSFNLELRDRLVDRERAEDQEYQIARIPEERQIEILENWMGDAA